jgi:hypothetical protein
MDGDRSFQHGGNNDLVEEEIHSRLRRRSSKSSTSANRKKNILFWLSLFFQGSFYTGFGLAQQQQKKNRRQNHHNNHDGTSLECPHQQPSNDSSSKYDWETLDYYELLGLKPHDDNVRDKRSNTRRRGRKQQQKVDTSTVDTKDVRKAYRKQAQLHHPDKVVASDVSKEESNARFTRIAEGTCVACRTFFNGKQSHETQDTNYKPVT